MTLSSPLFKKLSAVILALQLGTPAICQVLTDVQASFSQYNKTLVQEKVFLHTDKAFYLSGEILWLKVYDVDATTHQPLAISKVAYAEVLDKNNVPVLQAKLALNDGSGSGSLYIPVNFTSGSYKVRAYTAWMKNFSTDCYFEKSITIVNPLVSPAVLEQQAVNYDIQFFPEGGNLVSGISSKVAFRVVGQDGKGLDFKGAIVDDHNDTVAHFSPLKFGIGSFSFTPVAGKTYKAVIKINGRSVVKALPTAMAQGYNVLLNDAGSGQVKVTVSSNTGGSDVYLFAHSGMVADVAQAAQLNNGVAVFTVDKAKLGEGVTHFIIFDGSKQAVCERLFFKRPAQKLFIDAAADQQAYQSRKKVSVAIGTKDDKGKLLPADMSLSVYKLDSLQLADKVDIFSYLWLTSDLKGNIESPGYYFANNTTETDEALDNLMLSQGWSRFTWTDVINNNPKTLKYLPEVNGLLVTGKLIDNRTGKTAAGIPAYMGVIGKRTQFYTSKSDADGNVLFNTRDLYGSGEVLFTTNTVTDSAYRVDVASPFSDQYAARNIPEWHVDKSLKNPLLTHSVNMQVQNIYAGTAIKQFYTPVVDSLAFYGKPDKAYLLDNYTRFTTMEEVLREYIHEVALSHEQKKFHVSILTANRGFLDNNPLVLYDGIPVFDMDKLMTIDPLKVRLLEAVAQKYYLGPVSEDGILNLSSYKNDFASYEIDPHSLVVDYEGLQLKRAFFSPVYETEDAVQSRKPDFRNLLYWSPDVYTSQTAGKTINFYTSDQTGTYIGVIQGISDSGQPAFKTFTFEVKK